LESSALSEDTAFLWTLANPKNEPLHLLALAALGRGTFVIQAAGADADPSQPNRTLDRADPASQFNSAVSALHTNTGSFFGRVSELVRFAFSFPKQRA
jgi:hypothetical protein